MASAGESTATGDFPDDEVARIWGLNDDEWPMLIVKLQIPASEPNPVETVWFGGEANRLSLETIDYPLINEIHAATKRASGTQASEPPRTGSGEIKLPPPAWSDRAFGEVVRARRSALDFEGGPAGISLAQLSAMLATIGAARLIQLYLYVHRVTGLEPGIYRHWPECAELELIKPGNQRVAAAGLSLGQDLAGNACVAFSMIADLERGARVYGDRSYRYAHFEAGAIGHRLYLAAEALGFGATGIGAFFDDEVHRYLDLSPDQGQVVYHFAIGHPVADARLEA
jgi:SagB-type dehydrogenase family enzyme